MAMPQLNKKADTFLLEEFDSIQSTMHPEIHMAEGTDVIRHSEASCAICSNVNLDRITLLVTTSYQVWSKKDIVPKL